MLATECAVVTALDNEPVITLRVGGTLGVPSTAPAELVRVMASTSVI